MRRSTRKILSALTPLIIIALVVGMVYVAYTKNANKINNEENNNNNNNKPSVSAEKNIESSDDLSVLNNEEIEEKKNEIIDRLDDAVVSQNENSDSPSSKSNVLDILDNTSDSESISQADTIPATKEDVLKILNNN